MQNDSITRFSNAFDSETLLAALGTIAIACLLFAWQSRGNRHQTRSWLGYAAVTLELLAGSMAVYWASTNGTGLLTWVFVGGFIGLAMAKATIVSAVVTAYERRFFGALLVSIITLLGAYSTVYFAGAFHGGMESAGKAAAEAEASAPIRAIDAQLVAARTKLEGLSQYADSSKAQSQSGKSDRLKTQLAEEQEALRACPRNYVTRCIAPAQKRIREIERQLITLTYHSGHESYSGVQALIADLEQQRSGLLGSGIIPSASGYGADDQMMAWILGVSDDEARHLKWLVFVFMFDVLSLLFRLTGDMVSSGIPQAKLIGRQLSVLIESGVPVSTAAAMLAQGQVLQLASSGAAEVSLEPHAYSQALGNEDDLYPQWLDELRQGKSKPTGRPIKSFLNNHLCVDGAKNTLTPSQMDEIAAKWIGRALQDGVIEETGHGQGKAKYRLVA